MGVIDKTPGYGEDGMYLFSSRPVTPRDKGGDIVVKFQAVSRTQQTLSHHYITVSSNDRLSHVRRSINVHFKEYFERGFIFLCKTREILRADEKTTTVFDILPKIPQMCSPDQGRSKSKWELPMKNFRYPDVEYKRVLHTYDGKRYIVLCACVVFLHERSKVSHWPPHELRQQLCENLLEGFSFIPTDIMSWKPKLIELKATILHLNAACGNINELEDAIQKLPKTPKIADICDERNATPLHYAAENGKLDACEILINGIGRDQIYAKDINGRSPLHCALYRRRKAVIVYLLQLNSEIQDVDYLGNNCIDLLLLQSNVDMEYIASNLETGSLDRHLQFYLCYLMLYMQKETNSFRIVQTLPDYDMFDHGLLELGCSLLHLSSKLSPQLTEALLAKHFPKFEINVEGDLPFHAACQCGNVKQINLLYDETFSDADLNKGIQIALRNGHYGACDALKKIKSNLLLHETTVCMIMESLNKTFEGFRKGDKKRKHVEFVAEKLLPLLNGQNGAAEQYVFETAFLGLYKTLSLLKSLGLPFDLSDEMGRTPLHEACQKNHRDCVDILLKGGAKPNVVDWRGATPLHYACEKGHDAIVKILLQSGQKVNPAVQDDSGRTPLMTAIYRNQHKVVRMLLQNYSTKCNLQAVDNLGQNILYYLPSIEEDLEDVVIQNFKIEHSGHMKQNKGIQQHGDRTIVWDGSVTFTDFCMFERPFRELNMKEDPFQYDNKHEKPWNEIWTFHKKTLKSIASPSKQYTKCKKCNRIIKSKAKHVCSDYDSENQESLVTVKAFEFHHHEDPDMSIPLQCALKFGRLTTFKKLAHNFPNFLKDVDSLRRSILYFALQQCSVKVIKPVTDVVKPKSDCLHHLMMFARNGKTLAAQKAIEHLLLSGLSTSDIPEPMDVTHNFCGYEKDTNHRRCHLNCYLKSHPAIEAAVILQNVPIFNAVLEKTKEEHLGIALHLAVYFGQCRFIDAILKKKKKRETSKDIQKMEEMYILDIACRSPHISDKVFETLLKYLPNILESQEIFTSDDLSEFRPHIWENMKLLSMNEKTTLAKLLSTGHPVRTLNEKNTKTHDRLKMIDKAGCLLVQSGVQLGKFEISEESEDGYIHGICEALLPALESGHFSSAALMIQKEGHILWHCALSKNKCNIQKRFGKKWEPKPNSEKELITDQHVMIDYIKYVLTFACQKRIPENVLQSLIQSGMEVEGMQATDIPDKEFESTERLYALNGCKSPTEKIMRCALEILTGGTYEGEISRHSTRQSLWTYAKNYKVDVLRILKFAPGAVTSFGRSNIKPLLYLMLSKEELRLLRDCTIMMNLSGQSGCVTFPSGTTLLHLACCTANVEFVKMMSQAPFPVKIDAKTKDGIRPLDLAVIYGSWDIYKFLVENGATFTSETFVACCSDDRYKNVKSWTERIRNFRQCEKPSAKTKKRILVDLYERKKIDWNSLDKESGGPLHNAIDCHLDDVIVYLVDANPSLLITALNYDPDVAARMQKCKEGTIAHVFNAMAIQVSKLDVKALGKVLLHTAISRRKNLTETLTNTFHRVINQEQWEEVVTEVDKHGRNVFHFVAMFGWENIARQLIQVIHREHLPDFPLNKVDLAGASPLWYALAFKQWKTAELYLLNGASPILRRAIPGCFTKKPKPLHMIDLCFHECEHSNVYRTVKGINMSSRRKVKVSRDKIKSVITGQEENDISSAEKHQIERSAKEVSNTKVTFRPKYPPSMSRHKDQKRVEYLLKKAYLSLQLGYSLIHFASRTGDMKLFEDIIGISEEKLKSGCHNVEAGHMLAILGGHIPICDTYRENDIHPSKGETFHCIVWQALRTEDIQKNVHHFFSSILGFVYNNTAKSDNISVPRKKVVPTFHGFSYKLNKHKFEEHLANLYESLTEQGVEQTLIDQMESAMRYMYDKLYNNLTERQSFATLENYPQRSDAKLNEKNLTNFLKSVDAKTKIDEKDILLLLSMNQPWVISSLIGASKNNKHVVHLMKRQLLWGLNILDCIVISLPEDYGRRDKVLRFQQDISEDIGVLVNQFDMGLQESTVLYASDKNLWTVLKLVATQQIPKERELKVCWQMSLAQAVRKGQLDFVKSIVDNISISKLPEAVQASFAALLCNGAFYGQTAIVKYLFRKSVPIKFDTENPLFVDLVDKIYVKKFDVVEYAIQSKRPETVDAVIKFCKYDREFMKNAKPESYFALAAANGNWQIMKYFIDLFPNTGQPSKQAWERFFTQAARRGQKDFCAQVLGVINNVNVLCVDKTNKNILHYCGIYNMTNVAHQVLEQTPHGLDLSDSDGMRPIDYAVILGNIEVVNLFMKTKPMHSKQNMDSVEPYGWFRFFLDQINTDEMETSEVIIRPCLPKSRTLDLFNLYRKGDDNAAAALVSCSKHLPKLLLENPTNNGILLHGAIRYGCVKSFHNIMAYFAGEKDNIRQILKIEFKGLSPLALAVNSSQSAIAEYVFMYDDGLSWKSKKSAENILHLAIHTGDPKMIELVASKTQGRLCDEKDMNGFTPIMYLCALGLQDYYALLKTDALLDPLIDSHVGHKDDEPDIACLNCLLNRCIGWLKIYSRAPVVNATQSMRSVQNALPPPLLKEYFWKLGKYRKESPLITSIMISCGYTATYSSLVKLMSRGEKIQKMISMEGVEKTLDEFQNSLENILEISIVAKNEAVFVELLDHASGLNDQLKKTHGISIFEVVIGLSRLNLLIHLKGKLKFQDDDLSTFKEIYSTLPQKQRWLSELDHIGGENWPHFESSPDRHDPRILKSDLWLVESMALPKSIRKDTEANSVNENIIPSDYLGLKYTTDLDSFRKIPYFVDYTDIWIQCFLASSLVLSHIQDIKNCQDPKFISAKSIKVACLAFGTTDHPKVTIDNNGALLNQIRISVDKGVSSVRQDRSFCQRPEEIRLKADVEENVIPFFENFIETEFGLNLKIKVDWNAIELRKRTYNTEVIMKSLNGGIYGNKLGGLDDVLKECRDMKDDIESMFDKETAKYALRDAANITGITVSFDDKVVSQQASYNSGQRHILGEVVWKFTITQSRLYYDRSQFPLWQCLTIYRSICASTCHSVYCISNINASPENNDRKNRPLQSLSFEVDLQSFGITDLSILRTLMCRDVGREFVAIAYDCSSMLRLKNTSKRVLLKSTISLQHTGVTFQDDTTTIHICCNETNSKEWIVERSNSFSRLADAEDKQLMMEWPASYSQELSRKATKVQKNVQDKVGIAIAFQTDEKRVLLACLSKFRREMCHPHDLFKMSMTTSYQEYGNVYIQIVEDLLLLQKYPAIKQNCVEKVACGVWVRLNQGKPYPELLVLTKQLAKKNLMSSFESPKYNSLPIIKKESFEIVSESDAKKQVGMWRRETVTEKNQSDLGIEAVSIQEHVFTFSDSNFFNKSIENIPLRAIISQDTAHALEKGYCHILHTKVVDNISNYDYPMGETFKLHYQAKEQIRKLLNIRDVEIEWKSFVFKNSPLLKQNFAVCLNTVVDSFLEIFPTVPECVITQKVVVEMYSLFSGVSTLRIAMKENIHSDDNEDIERTINPEKNRSPVIRILKGDILEILFKRSENVTTFPDLLYEASIQLAEIKIKSLVGCRDRKQSSDNDPERVRKQASKSVILPSFKEVMLCMGDMKLALSSVSSSVKSFMTIAQDEVDDVYFVSSKRKTGFVVRNRTLLYNVSKKAVTPTDLANQLLEEFGFQGLKTSLVVPDLSVNDPPIINKYSSTLEVTMTINDYNKETADSIGHLNLTDSQDYSITLEGFSEALEVSGVEQKGEHLVLKVPVAGEKVKVYNAQSVLVHHKFVRPENCKTFIFGSRSSDILRHQHLQDTINVITVKKNEALEFLVEHKTKLHEGRDQREMNFNEGKHETVLPDRKIRFNFYYQKKSFPSSEPTLPFTLKTRQCTNPVRRRRFWGRRYSPVQYCVYSLLINDSKRHFTMSAQCLCCNQNLNIITRFGKLDAGRELRVNYLES